MATEPCLWQRRSLDCCEFVVHIEITCLLSMKNMDKVAVYFADSYSSWQKGAI